MYSPKTPSTTFRFVVFKTLLGIRRLTCLFTLALFCVVPSLAQEQHASAGTIEGRIFNQGTDTYINNARVVIRGTTLEAYTDQFGRYRLTNVPAGSTEVQVFYTGLPPMSVIVIVPGGQTVIQDFTLTARGLAAGSEDGKMIVLDKFVVAANREMDASSITINEQRFSPNIKTVAAIDEFGGVSEGNIAEFVKFLPGVGVTYTGGDASSFTLRGMPSQYTSVMSDGGAVASANSSNGGRQFQTEQIGANNIARIEVSMSPTPDIRADSLGGSINLISKSAFERTRPQFSYALYYAARDNDPEISLFGKTPGPARHETRPVSPSFDATWIDPVNDRFGYTVTASRSYVSAPAYSFSRHWVPDSIGIPTGYTSTTSVDPYLARYHYKDFPKITVRSSAGVTLDFKLRKNDTLTLRSNYTFYDAVFSNRALQFDVGRGATSWSDDFTQGNVGAGTASYTNDPSSHKFGGTWIHSISYRHNGPIWKVEANASRSDATNEYASQSKGYFDKLTIDMTGVTVRFDNASSPDTTPSVTVTDTAGKVLNPFDLSNYKIRSVENRQRHSEDIVSNANVSVTRAFSLDFPFSVKIGLDVREQTRDIVYTTDGRGTFVGQDGVANSADDVASVVRDYNFSRRAPGFGAPHTVAPFDSSGIQFASLYELYDLFVDHPNYFTWDEALNHRNIVNKSLAITETVSSAYIRLDAQFLNNRLKTVAGFRLEHTKDSGIGPRVDNNGQYRKNPDGSLELDGSGRPILISTDPLARAQLTHIYRGAQVTKSYQDIYPSMNATYSLRENLLMRVAYARTLGRPDFTNIIPGITLPDPGSTSRTITIKNPELKPWTSDSYDVALEYYFKDTGLLSVGVFRKDLTNFFGTKTVDATPELLQLYDLDPAIYADYLISTAFNAGSGRVTGMSMNYKQALTFLPEWARGVQVFGNITKLKLEGDNQADFNSFNPLIVNWGVSLSRPKFSIQTAFNYTDDTPGTILSGAGRPADSRRVRMALLNVNASVEYRLHRHVALFANVKNLSNNVNRLANYAPTTLDYARVNLSEQFGRVISIGIKGDF